MGVDIFEEYLDKDNKTELMKKLWKSQISETLLQEMTWKSPNVSSLHITANFNSNLTLPF